MLPNGNFVYNYHMKIQIWNLNAAKCFLLCYLSLILLPLDLHDPFCMTFLQGCCIDSIQTYLIIALDKMECRKRDKLTLTYMYF